MEQRPGVRKNAVRFHRKVGAELGDQRSRQIAELVAAVVTHGCLWPFRGTHSDTETRIRMALPRLTVGQADVPTPIAVAPTPPRSPATGEPASPGIRPTSAPRSPSRPVGTTEPSRSAVLSQQEE